MDRERWEHINSLFHEARELPRHQRQNYINRACADDADLRDELEGLLRESDCRTDGPLCGPAQWNAGRLVDGPESSDPLIGTQVGQHEIKRHLGKGGFGDVYLGMRTADFVQKVAIKLLHAGHHGNDAVLRRFEIERQVLSDLDHENIARLIDGGCTAEGRPYLVMEYVPGVAITEHCVASNLNIRERLELFLRVGGAVAHAHQFGVIHRDLKPTNVLVTRHGVPKLVDFGLAKLTDLRSQTEMLTLTRNGLLPLTPDYASPEQIRGDKVGLPTDVYSLGVLLYELLAGARPYCLSTCSASEIERVVCKEPTPLPSSTVIRLANMQISKTTGNGRNGDKNLLREQPSGLSAKEIPVSISDRADAKPPGCVHLADRQRLRRALRGDLDNIVLMAIRKEPERRYRSAAELCDDIRRHLAGLPVKARADSISYRTASLVRRNRAALLTCALVLLSLIGGAAASYVGWQRADHLAKRYREQLYVSDMQLGFDAYRQGQLDEVRRIVKRHSPDQTTTTGDGFEWRLLKHLSRPVAHLVLAGHEGPVHEVARVPGTQRIVSVGEDATIRVWDTVSGKLVSTLGPTDGPLHAVSVSPDGKLVAAGSQTVTLWDLAARRRVRDLKRFPATVESLAFSPDGAQLAIGVRYEGVVIVSVADGKTLSNHQNNNRFEKLAYLPDGERLICPVRQQESDHAIDFLQLVTVDLKETLQEYHASVLRHLALSRDGRWMAAASQYNLEIAIFDVESGKKIHTIASQNSGVRSLAVSSNDLVLAAGYEDGKVRLWPVHVASDTDPAAAPIVSVETDAPQVIQADSSPIPSMTFFGNDQLVTCGSDGKIEVWPVHLAHSADRIRPPGVTCLYASMSRRGRVAIVGESNEQVWVNDGQGSDVWHRLSTGKKFTHVAISADGSFLAVGRENGEVDLIDVNRPETTRSFQHGEKSANGICVSQDGRLLAVTGTDKCATLWSISDRALLYRWDLEDNGTGVALSPGAMYLAVGGNYRKLDIFQVSDGGLRTSCTVNADVTSLSWSDDGQILACGQKNGTILLYRAEDGYVTRLLGHQAGVGSLAFSRDGRTLVSGGGDSTVRFWHVPTGRRMGILYQASTPSPITGLFFSQDGSRLFASVWCPTGQGGILAWSTASASGP